MTTRAMFLTYVGLLALSALTLALSFVGLGRFAIPTALAIAFASAWLVAMYFMGLRQHGFANRAAMLLGITLMVLLIGFATTDVLTRVRPDIVPPGFGTQ